MAARSKRLGSVSTLIVTMMFGLLIFAAMSVDYAYMQLVRTELRSACDAAAKAGAEALSRTQRASDAKNEAVRYAASNLVAGKPFRLGQEQIVIGRVSESNSGKWTFKAGDTPPNAVRVDAKTGEGCPTPAIPLFFGRVLGTYGFTPVFQSTAGQQEVEVCLCLDRSGSMNWDMSTRNRVPPGNPNPSLPHPVHSRWAALKRAIDVFLDTAGQSSTPPRTALVTWASESSTDIDLPEIGLSDWGRNSSNVRGRVKSRGDQPISGTTNLSGGLDRAVSVLQSKNSRQFTSKVVVLLTDGDWNQGRHPVNAAYDARSAGIIVHCVSMLTQFQKDLQAVADITGGKYYGTSNEEELRAAFEEIARSLPVVLTE